MLIVLGILGSIIGLWDAVNRITEGHENLDVNEFASVKNNSHHDVHAPNPVVPVNKLNNLTASVLTTISTAQGNFDKLNKSLESTVQQENSQSSLNNANKPAATLAYEDSLQKNSILVSTPAINKADGQNSKGKVDPTTKSREGKTDPNTKNVSHPNPTNVIALEPTTVSDTHQVKVSSTPSLSQVSEGGSGASSSVDGKLLAATVEAKGSAQQTVPQRNVDAGHIQKSSMSPPENGNSSPTKQLPSASLQDAKASKT